MHQLKSKEDISKELIVIAERVLFSNNKSVDENTELFGNSSEVSSAKLIEMVFAVETQYQIEFDPEYMQQKYFLSVDTLTNTVFSILEADKS
ncbi:hypothetical protein MHO82_17425 [Vibrio sp. Of7-15]|uniref:hypothetical protein n=1 Tax=Vibrio sp. Of7-15 TaxID=2724879 RepID=UPI001EF18409|nr:hypothetical protein [Vibrio sp. Of7-15]MCG7498651.1 hypothetical protein [Vibrio sp. Of7-15]